jgi:predicted negative regulator of RcsB-dependent stress response
MATQHLDLDEQEQIANIKYFWQKYGLWISSVITAIALSYLGWTAWQYWQNQQSQKAAVLFDEFSKALVTGDITKTDRVFADMKDKFPATSYAAQTALLTARLSYEKGNVESTQKALTWVIESSTDVAYKDVAKLRLSGVLIEAKKYDEAIKWLSTDIQPAFEGLAADRIGDAYMLQNKTKEAIEQYMKAYKSLDTNNEYKKMIEVKLARLGIDANSDKK